MTDDCTSGRGAIRGALADLAWRLGAELDLEQVDLFDGEFRALEDPARLSLRTPAALVAVTGFRTGRLGQSRWEPGQLAGLAAGDPPAQFPRPGQVAGDAPEDPPCPPGAGARGAPAGVPPAVTLLEIDIVVALLSAAATTAARTGEVTDLAEASVPVLAGAGLTELAGSSLYTAALAQRGLAAFVVAGRRVAEAAAMPRAARRPDRVDALDGTGVREALWVRGAP